MNKGWDLADLEVFCAVLRRSSFTGAAKELGLSSAQVTKRIAGLERALGVTLFHRTTRRVHVSRTGEAAYAWARKVFEAADGLNAEVTAAKGVPTGMLRISTSMKLGRTHVAPILALMVDRYPRLEVWLEMVDRRIDLLAEGFDLDIRVGDASEPHLIAHRIAQSVRVLCAAPSYLRRRGQPRTLNEVAQHDCLLFRDREQAFGVLRMEGPRRQHEARTATVLSAGRRLRGHAGASNSARLRVCLAFLQKHLTRGTFALDTSAA